MYDQGWGNHVVKNANIGGASGSDQWEVATNARAPSGTVQVGGGSSSSGYNQDDHTGRAPSGVDHRGVVTYDDYQKDDDAGWAH